MNFRQISFSETRMQPRNEPLRAGPSLTSLHINCPLDTSVREKSGGGLTSYCTPGRCPPLIGVGGRMLPKRLRYKTPIRRGIQGSPGSPRNPAYPILGTLRVDEVEHTF